MVECGAARGFSGHVVCAFGFYHAWSHEAAYEDTARQTGALPGDQWRRGGGLYINYIFAAVWAADVVWSGVARDGYGQRPGWLVWTGRGFFLFMICNGAVVFVQGCVRWMGLVLCAVLVASWWIGGQRLARDVQDGEA